MENKNKEEREIKSLKDKINFIGENIYNLIDLIENENNKEDYLFIIYELSNYISNLKINGDK